MGPARTPAPSPRLRLLAITLPALLLLPGCIEFGGDGPVELPSVAVEVQNLGYAAINVTVEVFGPDSALVYSENFSVPAKWAIEKNSGPLSWAGNHAVRVRTSHDKVQNSQRLYFDTARCPEETTIKTKLAYDTLPRLHLVSREVVNCHEVTSTGAPTSPPPTPAGNASTRTS